jgi:signal transduction histidine kinase
MSHKSKKQASLEAQQENEQLQRTTVTNGHTHYNQAEYSQRLLQLAQAAETILATMDLSELWTAVANAMQTLFQPDALAICYYDPDNPVQIDTYSHNLSGRFLKYIASRPALWRQNQVISYTTVDPHQANSSLHQKFQAEGIHTAAVFPFMANDEHQGGIAIYWKTAAAASSTPAVTLTPDDIATGKMVVHVTSIALQNIGLFAAQNRALQREQQLNEFSRALNEIQDLPSILSYVVRMATELVNAKSGILGLIIDDQVILFYPYNTPASLNLRPLPRGQSLTWEIVETGQSILLPHYPSHSLADPELVKLGVHSFLGVPITAPGDICLGTISFFKTMPSDVFHRRDRDLVESLARQAGIAIQNSRLYAELERRAGALANALTRQEELDRLKNLFVQNVSHELRTPLGIIYGHAELLETGALGELQTNQKESVGIIARRARMLTDLVEDLTALLAAETQEFRREAIDPIQLINALMADYRLQAEEIGLTIKTVMPQTMPQITGDPTHLRRVFDNLVSNAFKFTPVDGTITIRLWAETNEVQIEVNDTGIGIPVEQLDRIFERFYQVDGSATRRYGGTGLGLALVKEIVTAHHGRVSVRSQEGEGTTFRISLPAMNG